MLLQHGGGQTRHAWKGTGEALGAAGYYAVAFDARGHGDSDWAGDGLYGQDVMVQDLQCVITALGQHRPVLVGASMGGGTRSLGGRRKSIEKATISGVLDPFPASK
ncbi:MAG: alpha/beta fold hydrolase [Burkholderiaceae bacterium]|nr:alpha/beta fold hydrolase [Burkholderiaceae bacterium]